MEKIYPITFSIPIEKLCNCDTEKKKILSNLIPGNIATYIYNTEEEYYNEYRESYFAITTKKAGWDCLRHYEILANGCIPYFINIEECPKNTMGLLPKELLLKSNKLYETIKNKNINELTQEEIDKINILKTDLFKYTKHYLTTNKIAIYILQTTNYRHVSNILYLSGDIKPDYLRCLTLHGFKEIFGNNCHDYPKIPHIYRSDNINYNKLYGKGFTYTNLLDQSLRNDNLDNTIVEDIQNKKYDIIIYGSYHRGMPYYDLICKIYKPNEIILLCGEDIHNCNYKYYLNKGHYIFVREL